MNPYRPMGRRPRVSWVPSWLALVGYHARRALFPVPALAAFSIAVLVLTAAMLLTGCGNSQLQIQAQTANAVAQAANSALPLLVERFRREGFSAIDQVRARAGSEEDARAAVAAVEARWEPIWKAWDVLKVAQDGWAIAVESGGDTDAALKGLKDAYCGLRSVWPEGLPAVPLAPLRCPGE